MISRVLLEKAIIRLSSYSATSCSVDSTCNKCQNCRSRLIDHCFATARPMLWNSLPEQLRQPDMTFGQFKRSLKTFMFG